MTTFKATAAKMQNKTTTTNGAKAFVSTTNANLDFFSRIGGLRGSTTQALGLFMKAFSEDRDLAIRNLLWARDIRGGAGERQNVRHILRYVSETYPEVITDSNLIYTLVEVGRWDDLLDLLLVAKDSKDRVVLLSNSRVGELIVNQIKGALQAENGLCAKWMPRKGDLAVYLRTQLGLTPKQYRKTLVNLTNVVETQMCNREFDAINFSHVPSQAMSKYMTAFHRNAPVAFQAYKESLVKGEVKVNASTLYPHQCVIDLRSKDKTIVNAQWKALPDYIKGDFGILPMVDVSGSMSCPLGADRSLGYASNAPRCIDAAIALGLYCSERNQGAFNNLYLTFSERPTIVEAKGNDLHEKVYNMNKANWGMNTDVDKAFDLILQVAVKGNLLPEQMPKMLLILSDMQFDGCAKLTAFKSLKDKYKEAGYELPRVVFWNLNAKAGNSPVKAGKDGVALVSGFSPAILKSLLADNLEQFTPASIMLDTINVDRYNWQ